MNRQIIFQLGNRQIRLSTLPSWRELFTKQTIANGLDKITELAFQLFIVVAPAAIILFPTLSSASLVLFYLLSVLIFVNLAVKFALVDRKFLVEVPWLINLILFAVINMTLLLLASKRAALVGNENAFESGLTYVSIVLIFYFMSLKSQALNLTNRLINLIVAGLALTAVFSFFDHIILANLAAFILVSVLPYGIYRLSAKPVNYWSVIMVLVGTVYLVHYFQTVQDFIALGFTGLFLLVLSALWLVRERKPISGVVAQITKRDLAAVENLRPVLLLIYAVVLVVLAVVAFTNNDLAAKEITEIGSAYMTALQSITYTTSGIFLGNVPATDAAILPLISNLIRAGVVILLSHLAMFTVILFKARKKANLRVAAFILFFVVASLVLPVPSTIYLLFWLTSSLVLIDEVRRG